MAQQNFNAVAIAPVEEKSGALFSGCGPFHCRTLSRTVSGLPPAQMAQKLCERHGVEYPVGRHPTFTRQFLRPNACLWRTYEMADRMEETMMEQKSLFILLFDAQYGFDVAGGSPGRIS